MTRKRKPIKKEVRIRVWKKYGKRCAYCGIKLNYKDMQVDHLHPVARKHQEPNKNNNRFENLMPSCRSCNYYKKTYKLDKFRSELNKVHIRLKSKFLVRLALRYKIIKFRKFDNLFYFEKIKGVYFDKKKKRKKAKNK